MHKHIHIHKQYAHVYTCTHTPTHAHIYTHRYTHDTHIVHDIRREKHWEEEGFQWKKEGDKRS